LARWLRIYEKKRGHRRTGSQKLASLGEALFFSVFLGIGLILLVALLVRLVIPEWRANRQFVETTCVVLNKRIVPKTARDGGVAFRPDVLIRYEADGRVLNRYTFDAVGTTYDNEEQAKAVASRFKVGSRYPCWYDPLDPQRVVLVQGYSGWLYLFLLVPLPFITIGGGGLIFALVHWSTSAERRSALATRAAQLDPFDNPSVAQKNYPGVPAEGNLTNSPGTALAFRLPVTAAPGWRLFATLVACLVWNGIVFAFAVAAIGRHGRGEPDWLLTLFVVVFGIAGAGLIVYFVRQLLATTGVGPTRIEISQHPLYPGGSYEVFVSQAGRLSIGSLRVLLNCEEKATYRQGTDTRTERRRIFEEELFSQEGFEVHQGLPFEHRLSVRIPESAMHSFKSDHNEIGWSLEVRGAVDGWPDFARVFPVVVYPARERAEP